MKNKEYIVISATQKMLKEDWDKLEEWEKISLVAPKGIWNEENGDEDEEREENN